VVQNRKIELPFHGFNLLPGNRHEHGVDVSPCQARQNVVGLRRCTRRRVAQFAAQDDEWAPVDNQLSWLVRTVKVRDLLSQKPRIR